MSHEVASLPVPVDEPLLQGGPRRSLPPLLAPPPSGPALQPLSVLL